MQSSLSRVSFPISRMLVRGLAAGVIAVSPWAGSAYAAGPDTTAAADALWGQSQAVTADSAFYVIQVWWDQMSTAAQRDPHQRGMAELKQANADLLNAYSLLAKARSAPSPQPVPIIDPLLSRIYGAITGINAEAPLGGFLTWLNQRVLALEGRGSRAAISLQLLEHFGTQQQLADRDLAADASESTKALWVVNSGRQALFLAKIRKLAAPSPDGAHLTDVLTHLEKERVDLLKKYAPKRPDSTIRSGPVPPHKPGPAGPPKGTDSRYQEDD